MTSNVFEEQFAEHVSNALSACDTHANLYQLSSVAAEDLNLGGIQHEGEMAIENEDMLKEVSAPDMFSKNLVPILDSLSEKASRKGLKEMTRKILTALT